VARRVLALVLLGVVVVVCAALAASESLRNDSRKTASAVTIQFSDSVRITSWDTATFPTCSPSSSQASTFRFSGGQLENGARFAVSWTPSTAEITNVEWETTGASGAGNASSAPLTYEQIMAQIAHYPGLDEPLYVPAEGEQIWLTDLEGHADIYDNDSIKINYAPWFDKSQITRIDVYRNGVKMGLVPALFDVLTNEEMKTFDGNPLENTPKSSHTDHAIFGYTYAFSFTGVNSPGTRLSARVRSPIGFSGATRIASVAHDYYSRLDLPDDNLRATMETWKSEGFTGIQLEANYYMASASANDFFAQYTVDAAVCEPWMRTATEPEIRRTLQLAKSAGMETELRLEITLAKGYVQAQKEWTWRGAIAPTDPAKWFSNHTDLCVRLARLGEEEHLDTFCLGVELNSMERYTEQWKSLASAVRAVFSGKLAFSESTHHYLAGFNTYNAETAFAKNVGNFWDSLDIIGMNYWPVHTGRLVENQKDARFTVMVVNFITLWSQAVEYYRSRYPGKTLVFEEMGIYEFDGAASTYASGAWVTPPGAVSDHQEFADMWAAYVAGAEYLGLDGMTFWTFELDPQHGRLWLGTHQINMTPAIWTIGAILSQ